MVELVRAGRTPDDLAREFEPSGHSIRTWVAQADRNEGRREEAPTGLTAAERDELTRLRRENKQLRLERFCASVAEADTLARPEDFDSYEVLGKHYATMRRWAPMFLAAFSFEGVPAAASLLQAIEMLREMNGTASPKLPKSVPTGFIRERWARYVMSGGALDRRYYELCVLSELCGRLRAGDVWVVGSRRYRSFEERLISREVLQELLQSGTPPVAVDPDFGNYPF